MGNHFQRQQPLQEVVEVLDPEQVAGGGGPAADAHDDDNEVVGGRRGVKRSHNRYLISRKI